MESATDVVKTAASDNSEGFFKTVFNFDEDSKGEMLNMVQYMILAVIPCVIILKAVRAVIPEDDDSKGSLEILAEIIGQIAMMVILMYFSNKAIRYVPTYSGVKYVGGGSMEVFLLPFMILLLTMQTKVGEKVEILFERVMDLWHGRSEDAVPVKNTKNNVKVSQPLAGQHNASRADAPDMSHGGLLPSNPGVTMMVPNTTNIQPQQSPDFNLMYQNETTPMPGANTPGQEGFSGGMMEPMAANSVLGGGGFSSW